MVSASARAAGTRENGGRGTKRREILIASVSLGALASPSGVLGGRKGAVAIADAGERSERVAYFAAGDPKQLAPFFRALSYRGVLAANVGLAASPSSDAANEVVEAVRVRYDPKRISFSDLLRVYFRRVDATDGGGQFKGESQH